MSRRWSRESPSTSIWGATKSPSPSWKASCRSIRSASGCAASSRFIPQRAPGRCARGFIGKAVACLTRSWAAARRGAAAARACHSRNRGPRRSRHPRQLTWALGNAAAASASFAGLACSTGRCTYSPERSPASSWRSLADHLLQRGTAQLGRRRQRGDEDGRGQRADRRGVGRWRSRSGSAPWVGNGDDGTVSRIDPNSQEVVKTIGLGVDVSTSRSATVPSGWRAGTRGR